MSLENLLQTKQLQPHNPTREAVQRLLQAAARNIADARVKTISGENRFDAAYKAIMQCAMVALWANRYRTSTSQPGHHQTAIQALPKTIGLDLARLRERGRGRGSALGYEILDEPPTQILCR